MTVRTFFNHEPVPSKRLDKSSFVAENQPVSGRSVFGDPVWYMESLVSLPGLKVGRKSWDFSKVPGFPGGFALSMAEYAYARLHAPSVSYGKEVQWLTVFNDLFYLMVFVDFCAQRGLNGFHEVEKSHLEDYLRELQFGKSGNARSEERIRQLIGVIYRLWDFRSKVGNCLSAIPFGKSLKRLLGAESGWSENATPPIPEPVFSAVMSAALDYVLEYGPTIIRAWEGLCERWDNDNEWSLRPRGRANTLYAEAKSTLQSTPATWLQQPWAGLDSLYTELQQLRTAAMLVVLAFSGVRASELLSIEQGCCVDEELDDGGTRYYLNTLVHKYRPGGSRDTWVVVEEVVCALRVLERLTARARRATGDRRLFLSDGSPAFFSVPHRFVRESMSELTYEALTLQMSSFQAHCSKKLGRPIPEWPDENGVVKPWRLNTRQFRRTLARFIAREPFGVIAGMLQYKHIETAIFEGYAGSEPDWNKMLADEKVLASIDILDEVSMDLSNGEVSGELGKRLKIDFELEFKGRAEDFPPSQIAKWLANAEKPFFVGKFNFCFFDPTKALCTERGASHPVMNHCQPGVCDNACVTRRHLPNWEAQLKQAQEFAAHPKASCLHKAAMAAEVAQLRAVIEGCGSVQ